MPADNLIKFLINIIASFSIFWVVKFLFLIGLLIYIAFAVIVIRQVELMARTVNGGYEAPLKLIAFIHLISAVATFLLALAIL